MTATATPNDRRTLYRATAGKVTVIDVPELRFAAVDGQGGPGDASFGTAITGLYSIAYGVRFALRAKGCDEKVSPLEALWWTADSAADYADAMARGGFTLSDQATWSWTAMIRLPGAAEEDVVRAVKANAGRRRPEQRVALSAVDIRRWREGLSVQTLHVGPYADEPRTVQIMHDFIEAHGYRAIGRHHEIYLGDPRRCAPARLRTILRQPVAVVGAGEG